ncbi:MAG: CvpA family protein [Pseudomonadota bacterium]
MNYVDIAILVIVLVSVLIGLFRGFIRETLSLISWGVALWVAYVFANTGAVYLEPYIPQPPLRIAAAFAGIFLVVLIAASIVSYIIYRLIAVAGISGIDRTLGTLFGLVRGIVIVAALILAAIFTDFATQPWWKQSLLVEHFNPIVEFLRSLMPPEIGKYFIKDVNEIEAIQSGSGTSAGANSTSTEN